MALPITGKITLGDIRDEFGGSNPVKLSDYYKGGGLVPDIFNNESVPTSGTIKISDFYGASAVTTETLSVSPVSNDVSSNAATYTVQVSSNTSWTFSSNVSWLPSSVSQQNGNVNVTINVASNNSSSSRNGVITFTTVNDGITARHQVTQSAPTLVYNAYTVSFSSNLSTACSGSLNTTVYSTASTFANSSQLFIDNGGNIPVSGGYYSNGLVALFVYSSGDVTSNSICRIRR
jgi:hypothetical protein